MGGSCRLLTEPPVDLLTIGAGDGDDLIADMGAMLGNFVYPVQRQGIGAMHADESFGRQFSRDVGQRLMHDVCLRLRNDAHIVPQAFDVQQFGGVYTYPLIVGAEKKRVFFVGSWRRLWLLQRPRRFFYGLQEAGKRKGFDQVIQHFPFESFHGIVTVGGGDDYQWPLRQAFEEIEAGELRPEAPLRKTCERARNAIAIACYPDTERDLVKLIDDELRLSNLKIAQDARATLMSLLGGDRQASRNELRKIVLYAHGQREITLDDVMAVVSDASDFKLDPIVDGAFAGQPAMVESEFAKAMIAGTYPGLIISAAQRQVAALHKAALLMEGGASASSAAENGFPRLHFSRKNVVETALRNFSAIRLVQVMDQLATAALDVRKQSSLAAVIAQRALMSIAANARRRG